MVSELPLSEQVAIEQARAAKLGAKIRAALTKLDAAADPGLTPLGHPFPAVAPNTPSLDSLMEKYL